jgi:hypothetical protein
MMFYSPSLKRHVAKIINMVLFYQIYRVSGQNDNAQMEFMQRWDI